MAINFPANPSINDTFIVSGTIFTWSGVKWQSTAVTEISSDTSPQLGGTLDANSQNINNVNDLVVNGNLTVQGTTSTIDTVVTAVDSLNVEGSVGIGTTTPNYKLEIDGDVGIRNNSESDLYFDVDYGNGTTSSAAIFSYPTRFGIKQGGNSRADNYIFYYNQDASTAANDYIYMQCGDAERLRITGSGDVNITGTVSDSIGSLRDVPLNDQSSSASYTLTASDAGKVVHAYSTTTTVVVPNSVFSAGNVVTILNGGTSNISISQGSGLSLRNSGDGSTGNRTLAQYGMATIYFSGASVGYISGSNMT